MSAHPEPPSDAPPWLSGGGEMGALLRRIDWTRTALGSPWTWPPALRTMLGVLLTSQHPMFIYWGPELIQFYNDAYRPILGSTKHPAAMGQPGRECWQEVWHILEPMMDKALAGSPTFVKDGLLALDRHGFLEECYFDYAYTPIRDERGQVAGVFVPCGETTGRILSERRLTTLGAISARTSEARTADQACQLAAAVLEEARADLPFVLVYLDGDDHPARLALSIGLDGETAGLVPWPLERARAGEVEVALSGLPGTANLTAGPWPEPPARALIVPLRSGADGRECGFLVAGVSPRLRFDDAYRNFVRLVANHLSSAIQTATAYEQERTRAEKLQELDRARTAFFSNVSHELRTPLTLILGPTEQLLEAPDLPAPWRRELETVTRNARTLLHHVNDLLDVARLDAGKMDVSYAEIDLASIVRLAASHFEALASQRRIDLRVETSGVCPGAVDPAKVQRVLLNLISNAFKFTPDHGRVRCTLRREPTAEHVCIEVADSGPGIAAHLREVVFERFRQLEPTGTRRFGGTGLGLAITRELVELHGGQVTIDDAPEGGARFTVSLPLRPPAGVAVAAGVDVPALRSVAGEAVAAVPALVEGAAGVGGTVLVVEDNPEMNRFICASLASSYRLVQAFDGRQGLEAALAHRPDLIITDVMMPEMSGQQLVRALRGHAQLAGVPVVVLTAKMDDELRVALLRDGAQDYLTKPFSADELRARVRNLTAMKRARDTLQTAFATKTEDLEALSIEVAMGQRALEAALTQLHAREEQQRFLASTTATLIESLDYDTTVVRAASLAVPVLADWATLDLFDEDERLARVHVAHADPARAALAAELMRFAAPVASGGASAEPVLVEQLTDGGLAPIAASEDHRAIIRATGAVSAISVPVLAHGRLLGVLTLIAAESGRVYTSADLVLARDIAHRCAFAIDNARLFALARAATAARDEFLSIASHELRTPITALQIQIDTLERKLADYVKADKHAWVEKRLNSVHRSSHRIDGLIGEILDISRIAGGRLGLELERVDLAEVVREIVAEVADRPGKHQIRTELRPAVWGVWDRRRLKQVVSKLVSNALKFSDGQPIDIRLDVHDGIARVEVQDRGPGIAPGDQQRIFGRFERAVSSRHFGGLGLGLFIARQVVEAMGGVVDVASQPGRGSIFTVTLPCVGPAAATAPPHRREEESTSRW